MAKSELTVKKTMPITMNDELISQLNAEGLNEERIAKEIASVLTQKSIKIDKNGEIHEYIDLKVKLQALELLSKLLGLTNSKVKGEIHNHLHVEAVDDDRVDEIERKISKTSIN